MKILEHWPCRSGTTISRFTLETDTGRTVDGRVFKKRDGSLDVQLAPDFPSMDEKFAALEWVKAELLVKGRPRQPEAGEPKPTSADVIAAAVRRRPATG